MKTIGVIAAGALVLAGCARTADNTQAFNNGLAAGQLYCAMATVTGPLIVALADASGAPVTATGKGADVVSKACAVINAVPVMPPPNPDTVPVKAAEVPPAAMTTPPAMPSPAPAPAPAPAPIAAPVAAPVKP